MEKKKVDIAAMAIGAGKSAKDVIGKVKNKTVQIMDQNDDGKFDLKDVSQVAGAVENVVKKTAENVRKNAEEKTRLLEMKALQPIFESDLEDANFSLPKLVRICEIDKKRAESEVCQGAIGYFTDTKNLRVVNIYQNCIEKFHITFYPDCAYEFYYVDPRDRDRYIALDEYFGYLKMERVNELQKVAQDLGAKHFKVTYKEEKKAITGRQTKVNANVGVDADRSSESVEKSFTTLEIAAEMVCPGHAPIKPNLHYLSQDSSVQSLINMRMDSNSPLSHHKFMVKLSNSSGIKENDAVKIDAVLKSFKCSGNTTVMIEAQNESRRYLEYEIDF